MSETFHDEDIAPLDWALDGAVSALGDDGRLLHATALSLLLVLIVLADDVEQPVVCSYDRLAARIAPRLVRYVRRNDHRTAEDKISPGRLIPAGTTYNHDRIHTSALTQAKRRLESAGLVSAQRIVRLTVRSRSGIRVVEERRDGRGTPYRWHLDVPKGSAPIWPLARQNVWDQVYSHRLDPVSMAVLARLQYAANGDGRLVAQKRQDLARVAGVSPHTLDRVLEDSVPSVLGRHCGLAGLRRHKSKRGQPQRMTIQFEEADEGLGPLVVPHPDGELRQFVQDMHASSPARARDEALIQAALDEINDPDGKLYDEEPWESILAAAGLSSADP